LEKSYAYNERLIVLLNDLLEVSSVEEGRYDYQFEKVDIHDLLREVSDRQMDDVSRKMQEFKLNIVNNLANVSLDQYKIKLVIGTLLNNAIKYTPKHGHITIRSEFPDNKKVRISISDSGIGIPIMNQEKIFTKFFRAENAVRVDTEGNGLDLYVAKTIINNHNGKIWFKSQEGRGTTFFIELPTEQL
jgi:signal transduction histidine kinase